MATPLDTTGTPIQLPSLFETRVSSSSVALSLACLLNSYKWAEILSCDAYGAFQEAATTGGDEAVAAVGARFRQTILARGGAQHPLEVFAAFRGRKPSIEPLLTQYGLLAA